MTPRSHPDPYLSGLAMLARRELSAAQVRERLTRKGWGDDEARQAVERLQAEGAIDDRRTAAAYARRAATVKHRGRTRTLRELRELGISPALAGDAVDEVYAEIDEDSLLEHAVARRVRGRITTRAQFRRVYQALLRQGFDGGAVAAVLLTRSDDAAKTEDG